MLNFRKLKHDFSPAILKEGKSLYDKEMVLSVKILNLKPELIRFSCQVMGGFENAYESELEIDRTESVVIDSNCDCSYKYDCQHLAAILFYLESHYDQILVDYSKETDIENVSGVDDQTKESLREVFKEAESKEHARKDKKNSKDLLDEYIHASQILGQSSFFMPEEELDHDKAELALIFNPPQRLQENAPIEIQLSLRLPCRSKALIISHLAPFLDAVRYEESIYIGNKRYFFSLQSFDPVSAQLLKLVLESVKIYEKKEEKLQRSGFIDPESFGFLLAISFEAARSRSRSNAPFQQQEMEGMAMPCIYCGNIEEPLRLSLSPALLQFEMHYLEVPNPKLLLKPKLVLTDQVIKVEDATIFECAKPGLIYQNCYFRFQPLIKRKHLRSLSAISSMTIPEPLFGTFVENSLPELMRFSEIVNKDVIERFVTVPFVETVSAECDIQFLDGELEAALYFVYGDIKVPAASSRLQNSDLSAFVTQEGILARHLTEEQKIVDILFQDFYFDPVQGVFIARNDKKIVEFMTEIIPANQERVKFNCPENLLDQFIYDDTHFSLHLKETDRIDRYEVEVVVEGQLCGISIDVLWDCLVSKRAFIELSPGKGGKKKNKADSVVSHKILVLDLERLAPIIQVFDEIGIKDLSNHKEERPLWSLASLSVEGNHPINFTITPKLKKIQDQMLGHIPCEVKEIPKEIQASLRNYQMDGIHWLDRLRSMHLNGILADDMGLGKTLQAIITLTRHHKENPQFPSLVVCPTSLVHNWKEEITKFNPKLKVLAVDGNPAQRKKLLTEMKKFDVIVTSYTLLQKDIEIYKEILFGYAILDEAQHIKNRGTRNAQSVKLVQAAHRLILTGTPIENSLDELWSLFDFLMPGLLSTYDRFVEKYLKASPTGMGKNLENLRNKVAPFILRRMKKDVLDDLPPVSQIVYHCHLSDVQQELYRSYAASAREELSQLVKKEGFDRVQIHVLATLTRLKQICCHPAIFAKDKAESGDSAKYEMFIELLQNLMEGRHKTVIFSQYTRMLNIMREDLQKQGIRFEYLDGTSKNRLSIVKKFNEDPDIPIFLVSLKAGGAGLNLVGADTVIHYDMWWNPAVENQATDRVHRIGQKKSVSSYKLVTLNTIEEKIQELHNRKQSLVKDVVSKDEDVISKLTWEEVLELLQT